MATVMMHEGRTQVRRAYHAHGAKSRAMPSVRSLNSPLSALSRETSPHAFAKKMPLAGVQRPGADVRGHVLS